MQSNTVMWHARPESSIQMSSVSISRQNHTNRLINTQLYHGAVALHAIGTVYMFAGLAIVCDEY